MATAALTQAPPWDQDASASHGWVISPVLGALDPVSRCDMKWTELECLLLLG